MKNARLTQIHEVFLAKVSSCVNMKKPESELHSRGEQQGEETGGADQPPPATLRIEMCSHARDVNAF